MASIRWSDIKPSMASHTVCQPRVPFDVSFRPTHYHHAYDVVVVNQYFLGTIRNANAKSVTVWRDAARGMR